MEISPWLHDHHVTPGAHKHSCTSGDTKFDFVSSSGVLG